MNKLVEVFASQILNDDPNIIGTSELVQEAQLFSQVTDRVKTKK